MSARHAGARNGWFALGLSLLIAIPGCASTAPTGPADNPSPAASSSLASPVSPGTSVTATIPAAHDLFTPGLAQQAVTELVAAAEGKPVVRLVLDRTRARLTFVDAGDRPRSLVWQAGVITPSDDGTDLVAAASFDPARFNLTDVAALFATAADLSGSSTRQELQINEYDRGRIFMTITTSPESSTVFFDLDGVPVPRLDFAVDADLAAGIQDVLVNRLLVVEVGLDHPSQIWVDVVTSPGILERRIRPANQPMYYTQRRETAATSEFEASLIDPAVLARLIRIAPGLYGKQPDSPVSLRILQPADAAAPRVEVGVGASELVTDLAGAPLPES